MKRLLYILSFTLIISLSYGLFSLSFSPDRPSTKNNIIYPKADSTYIVKLLKAGEFNKNEINYDANTIEWYALLSDNKNFFIKEMRVEMEKLESDKGEKWKITGSDSLKNILFISGVELIPKDVEEMVLGRRELAPGDILQIDYNKKKYTFEAEGTELKKRGAGNVPTKYIGDYKLFISNGKKGKNKTLLVHLKELGEKTPSIVFMGDMDNDKVPDLILEIVDLDNTHHTCLFLSNHPPKGSVYKLSGIFKYKG